MCKDTIKALREQRLINPSAIEVRVKPLEKVSGVVYIEDDGPVFIARAYLRKGLKPKFAYRFHSRQRRDDYVAKWIKDEVEREERKQKDRKQRTAGHSLKVGDVLNTSWGYDQTNVDYYQVVGLKGKATVKLREISAIRVDDSHVVPAVDNFVGDVFEKRVNGVTNGVKISSCQFASLVTKDDKGNYKPSYKTPWGMGH